MYPDVLYIENSEFVHGAQPYDAVQTVVTDVFVKDLVVL